MKAPKMTLLSPVGRKVLGTSTKSQIVPPRQIIQIVGEIHRRRKNHHSEAPYLASTRFSIPPITRSIHVLLEPWPRSLRSRAHMSGVSVSDTSPDAKIDTT